MDGVTKENCRCAFPECNNDALGRDMVCDLGVSALQVLEAEKRAEDGRDGVRDATSECKLLRSADALTDCLSSVPRTAAEEPGRGACAVARMEAPVQESGRGACVVAQLEWLLENWEGSWREAEDAKDLSPALARLEAGLAELTSLED